MCRTINDLTFEISSAGVLIALISVVTSSMQQTSVRNMQNLRKREAFDLIASVGPGSGFLLILFSPVMDYTVTEQWIIDYSWSSIAIWGIVLSTLLAILVNLSQFLCLGKFSAVEFQMMGHVKTVAIFAISWVVLHENFSHVKWIGCIFTISGIYLFNKYPKPLPYQQETKLENLIYEETRKPLAVK